MAQRDISPERKLLYYGGMILTGIGLLMFLSVFTAGIRQIEQGPGFTSSRTIEFDMGPRGPVLKRTPSGSGQPSFATAFIGMLLMAAGGFMMKLGRYGPAGAGVILDPQEARRDVEPWSRMTGGMVHDALDEAGVKLGSTRRDAPDDSLPPDERLRRLEKLRKERLVDEQEYQQTRQRILKEL